MKKIFFAVLALLFFTYAYASDDLVIKVGMKLEEAQKMLQQAKAKEATMDMMYSPEGSSGDLETYGLPDGRVLAITSKNEGVGFIITSIDVCANCNLPKQFREWDMVQELNLNNQPVSSPVNSLLVKWNNKFPYPYEDEDKQLVTNSYKEKWVESSAEKYPEAVKKAKEVLRDWGQNPDKYEYAGKACDYKIAVSESPNFISVVFLPIGLEGLERHVEIRMIKKDLAILSILPGS